LEARGLQPFFEPLCYLERKPLRSSALKKQFSYQPTQRQLI